MLKIEIANWWLARGFAILPTQPEKKFLYAGFGEHQKKITRSNELAKWFDNDRVNMSVCGHGGTIILDFDFPDLYKAWCDKHPDLAATYTETTPRGGTHVFFFGSAPRGIQLVPGVEIKKVCVVSPSIVAGREYQRGSVIAENGGGILEARATDIFSSLSKPGSKTAYLLDVEQHKQKRERLPYRSKDLIQQIKDEHSIEYVWSIYRGELIKLPNGKYFSYISVLCPFHDDHKASMSLDLERQLFKCHACGAHGDVINLYALFEKITVNEAIMRMSRGLSKRAE